MKVYTIRCSGDMKSGCPFSVEVPRAGLEQGLATMREHCQERHHLFFDNREVRRREARWVSP